MWKTSREHRRPRAQGISTALSSQHFPRGSGASRKAHPKAVLGIFLKAAWLGTVCTTRGTGSLRHNIKMFIYAACKWLLTGSGGPQKGSARPELGAGWGMQAAPRPQLLRVLRCISPTSLPKESAKKLWIWKAPDL